MRIDYLVHLEGAALFPLGAASKITPGLQIRGSKFDGAAAWAWGFWTLRKSEKKIVKIQQILAQNLRKCWQKLARF